jgi:hypothetical protein
MKREVGDTETRGSQGAQPESSDEVNNTFLHILYQVFFFLFEITDEESPQSHNLGDLLTVRKVCRAILTKQHHAIRSCPIVPDRAHGLGAEQNDAVGRHHCMPREYCSTSYVSRYERDSFQYSLSDTARPSSSLYLLSEQILLITLPKHHKHVRIPQHRGIGQPGVWRKCPVLL